MSKIRAAYENMSMRVREVSRFPEGVQTSSISVNHFASNSWLSDKIGRCRATLEPRVHTVDVYLQMHLQDLERRGAFTLARRTWDQRVQARPSSPKAKKAAGDGWAASWPQGKSLYECLPTLGAVIYLFTGLERSYSSGLEEGPTKRLPPDEFNRLVEQVDLKLVV